MHNIGTKGMFTRYYARLQVASKNGEVRLFLLSLHRMGKSGQIVGTRVEASARL
jgi:hypothetical protein